MLHGADPGEPGDGSRLGRVFPLGNPGSLCVGQTGPAPGQLRDCASHRVGGIGWDVFMVDVR